MLPCFHCCEKKFAQFPIEIEFHVFAGIGIRWAEGQDAFVRCNARFFYDSSAKMPFYRGQNQVACCKDAQDRRRFPGCMRREIHPHPRVRHRFPRNQRQVGFDFFHRHIREDVSKREIRRNDILRKEHLNARRTIESVEIIVPVIGFDEGVRRKRELVYAAEGAVCKIRQTERHGLSCFSGKAQIGVLVPTDFRIIESRQFLLCCQASSGSKRSIPLFRQQRRRNDNVHHAFLGEAMSQISDCCDAVCFKIKNVIIVLGIFREFALEHRTAAWEDVVKTLLPDGILHRNSYTFSPEILENSGKVRQILFCAGEKHRIPSSLCLLYRFCEQRMHFGRCRRHFRCKDQRLHTERKCINARIGICIALIHAQLVCRAFHILIQVIDGDPVLDILRIQEKYIVQIARTHDFIKNPLPRHTVASKCLYRVMNIVCSHKSSLVNRSPLLYFIEEGNSRERHLVGGSGTGNSL